MRRFSPRFISTASVLAVSLAIGTPAFAQSTGQPQQPADQADEPEELEQNEVELESGQDAQAAGQQSGAILVTGSRIRRPNLQSTVPITSVGPQELLDRGDVSLGDALNELPALRSTFSQSNSTRFIGTGGVNWLDLRGLGTSRTLTLVNGRRHVTSTPGSFEIDTNQIPSDLIERVDIVTGGNSAIYGSDAVAGVVNFIMRRDFDGIRVRGQGGISSRADRGSYFASLTAGRNFIDNRANVAVAFEYARQDALLSVDRPGLTGAYTGQVGFFASQNTLGEPATGDGIPDTAFFRNIRNSQFSSGGGVIVACPTVRPANETVAHFNQRRLLTCTGLFSTTGNPATGAGELPYVFHFDENGNLIRNDAAAGVTGDLRPFGSGNVIGGLGSTFNEAFQLFPELERYAVNLLASFEMAPIFQPFLEAKFVRVNVVQNSPSGPVFQSGTLPVAMRLDNPFLSAENRALLQAILPPGATSFTMARNNVDFGPRAEFHERDTFRVVVGANGDITPNLRYEVAFNYGRLETFYDTGGNVHIQRYRNAQDAALGPGGNIVCRINIDASTANDDPACAPLNLFGNGRPSQAALDYVRIRSFRNEEAQQYNAIAFVSGDSGAFFELPGGPIGLALGVEWRRETAESVYDPIVSNPTRLTFLNSIQPFRPPALEIKEAFGELRIPLLRDMPLAHELSFEAAARVSDYSHGPSEPVWAYNFGATWAPIRDIRFRASYARAVRAPTLGDLFSPEIQTFAGIADPCNQNVINNNPNRVANCAAAGVPTTYTLPDTGEVVPFINVPGSTPAGLIRGNPNTLEETSTSWTVGTVIQPRWIPGFSLSIDYYDIEVEDVIFSLGGNTVVNLCYDNPGGIDNQYCAAVFRRPDGTFAGQTSINISGRTFQLPFLGPSFYQQPFNFAKLTTRGIDVDAAYRTRLGSNIVLNTRALVSYVINREQFTDVTSPDFGTRIHGTLGDPRWEFAFSTNIDFGMFDFGYNMRYLGKQSVAAWTVQHTHDGVGPTNPDAFPISDYPPITYHNIRLGFEPTEDFRFYMGMDNVFDRMPPALSGLNATGGGGAIYPITGRYFYAGVDVRF